MSEREWRLDRRAARGAELRIPAAIAAGALAAVGGAIAWGLVARWTDYEVGALAWGIGFVTGLAVGHAAGSRRTIGVQAIAVGAALLGVLLGKYLAFAMLVQEESELVGQGIGLFSSDMRELFRDRLDEVFGYYDLLWAGLAVVTAWYMVRPGESAAAAPPPAPGPAPTRACHRRSRQARRSLPSLRDAAHGTRSTA